MSRRTALDDLPWSFHDRTVGRSQEGSSRRGTTGITRPLELDLAK